METTPPPLAFQVIHLAVYVVLTLGTMLVYVIRVPPGSNHPRKLCPARVGVGSRLKNWLPRVRLELAGDTVPPLAFHVMVTRGMDACSTLIFWDIVWLLILVITAIEPCLYAPVLGVAVRVKEALPVPLAGVAVSQEVPTVHQDVIGSQMWLQ
jgi:hypothetical protein